MMKRFFFILFALILAVMSWEAQRSSAAGAVDDNGPIPKESIRLRIIANSDSFQDQWLKRKVRDSIVQQMNVWVKDLHSYDEAHSYVATKIPELQKVVDETISQYGFSYPAVVDFGEVPFPTKLYGSYVYPAGDYEALRVRIGEAKGQNWWCVLFPPLCFIDMSNGDAVQAKEVAAEPEPSTSDSIQSEQLTDTDEVAGEKRLMLVDRQARIVDYVDKAVKENFQSEVEQAEPTKPTEPTHEIAQAPVKAGVVIAAAPNVEIRSFIWDKLMSFF